MDLTALAHDIDELVQAFVKIEGTELSQMKDLWRARSFSFIHDARPQNVNPAFFMQALYSCALTHTVGELSFSEKLAGLYVLYALYETQQFQPSFKIYLSMEDLEGLVLLVKECKSNSLAVALKVMKTMMAKDMFLFGSVAVNQKKIKEAVDKLASQAESRLHYACKRLLSNSPVQRHLSGNLATELGLNELTALNEEYATAKQRVFKEAMQSEGVDMANRTNEDKIQLAEELKKDTESWIDHRQSFYKKKEKGLVDEFALELDKLLAED